MHFIESLNGLAPVFFFARENNASDALIEILLEFKKSSPVIFNGFRGKANSWSIHFIDQLRAEREKKSEGTFFIVCVNTVSAGLFKPPIHTYSVWRFYWKPTLKRWMLYDSRYEGCLSFEAFEEIHGCPVSCLKNRGGSENGPGNSDGVWPCSVFLP